MSWCTDTHTSTSLQQGEKLNHWRAAKTGLLFYEGVLSYVGVFKLNANTILEVAHLPIKKMEQKKMERKKKSSEQLEKMCFYPKHIAPGLKTQNRWQDTRAGWGRHREQGRANETDARQV